MMPAPLAFSRLTMPKRRSISRSLSAAVGSSITMMRALLREHLGDLDDLLLADRERRRGYVERQVDAEVVEGALGPRARRAAVEKKARGERLVAERDVLGGPSAPERG